MTSFFANSFEYFSNRPQNVCATLSSTRPIFHSSIIPVTLSTKALWRKLTKEVAKPGIEPDCFEGQLLSVFIQSDTMQFSSRIEIRSLHIHPDLVSFILDTLIDRRRYFIRTIKHITLSRPCMLFLTQICNKLPALQSLNLSGCRLDDDDIDEIASKLVLLRELDLSSTRGHSSAAFQPLKKMRCLESLILAENSSVNRAAISDISRISSLRKLDVKAFVGGSDASSISDDSSSAAMLTFNSNLQVLKIGGYWSINDQDLSKIGELRYLQVLDLMFCDDMTDAGFQHLSQCTLLSTLRLFHCSRLSSDCLNTVFSHLPALEDVSVDVSLADDSTPNLLMTLKSISCVDMKTLGSPTDAQIDQLCKTVTNLQMLCINEASRLTSLEPLVNLRHLKILILHDLANDAIRQGLTSIGALQNLTQLFMGSGTQNATFEDIDVGVLKNLKLLESVVFRRFPGLSVLALQHLLPSAHIVLSDF